MQQGLKTTLLEQWGIRVKAVRKKKKLKKKKGEGSVKRWEGLQPGRERIEWIVYQAEGTSRNRETDTIIKTI